MKVIVIMAFVLVLGLIILNRQREYVRDPLATVYRDNVRQPGVEVYQSFGGDVLIMKEDGPDAYRILLQDWTQVPATPGHLTCIQWLACLTDADHPGTIPLVWTGKGKYNPKANMTRSEVSFVAGDGATMRVTLR
jgi:hypothetical protein